MFALAGLAGVRLGEGRNDEAIGAADARRRPRPDQPRRPQHAGPRVLDGQGAARRRASPRSSGPAPTTPTPATSSSSWRCCGRSRAIWRRAEIEGRARRRPAGRLQVGRPKGCSWSAATSAWATSAIGRGATTARWRRSPASEAFLAEHDHALKGRLQIEILQKQGAAYWRKGDREAADRAFAEMMKAFRARQSRGADDPFTKYYVASLHALRGESRRRAALSGRLRGRAAGADPRPRPARPGFRCPAGGSGLPRPGRRRRRRRPGARRGRARTVTDCPFAPGSWRRARRRFTRSPL